MAKTTPAVRIDRDYMNELELYITEQILYLVADEINAATAAGPIYGQVLLPPEQAARKKMLMEQGGQQ